LPAAAASASGLQSSSAAQPKIAFYSNSDALADSPQFADGPALDTCNGGCAVRSKKGLASRTRSSGCATMRGSSAVM